MLRNFRDVPIRRKLTLLLLLASATGVLITGIGLGVYAWTSARAGMERDLGSVASILANNATAALAFRDSDTASEILSAMQAKPELEVGCLYLAERSDAPQLFAQYTTPEVTCDPEPGPQGVRQEGLSLVLVQPVVQAGERIGWLRLRANFKALQHALAVQAGIMFGIVLVAIGVSIGIAFAMQRVFAGPILRLAETARQVSQTRDYGLRVQAYGSDEVGGLVQDFNAMLDQIARADAEIKKAEERFRLTVEAAPNAMVVVGRDGRMNLVNTQVEKLFGYPRAELIGQPIEKLVPERFREDHPALRGAFLSQSKARSMGVGRELFGLTKDGREVPIEVGLSPIETPEGMVVLSSITDITERKRAEQALHQLNQSLEQQVTETARTNLELEVAMGRLKDAQIQLVQAEKMASLGALVAGVAHEINTPVGVGVTAASTLQARASQLRELYEKDGLRRSDLDRFVAMADESTQIILRNLQRAADLIHSFKQVAVDQSSGERRRFALKGYIDEVLLSLRPKLKVTSHTVEVECADDIVLDTYPGALAQILTNFVTNSLIHGFDNMQNGHIRIAISQQADRVTLQYRDDGRGIAPEHLARVFDPFFTTKRGTGGSGLGLHIVYNLVTQLLGGTIQVASEPGKGAAFVVQLPLKAHRRGDTSTLRAIGIV